MCVFIFSYGHILNRYSSYFDKMHVERVNINKNKRSHFNFSLVELGNFISTTTKLSMQLYITTTIIVETERKIPPRYGFQCAKQ